MPAHTESFNINLVEHKMPAPFLKDVEYKDKNGEIKTIKGFLGSVKNIKAVNNEQGNFLQPKIDQNKYRNVHMSLSSFFVDKNNTVYGDFFRGTVGANTYTQLFAIPQNQIIPICHKKQDIQIYIVGKNTNDWERNKNKEAIKYVNEFVSKNYNNDNQRKLKFFDENDNCLEKIYKKYQKLNKKLEDKDFNTLPNKYSHMVINKKINFNNGKNFNVEHDELIAVPKDPDYKTYFDCGIITRFVSQSIENIKKQLFIQAQCGYPYVVMFNEENNRLEYKLMSKYIESLKDNLNKEIECYNTQILKIEQNSYLVDCLKQINKQIENIVNNNQMTNDETSKMIEIYQKSLSEFIINGSNQHQGIIEIIEDLQNILSSYQQRNENDYKFAQERFQNNIDSFELYEIKLTKATFIKNIEENNQKIKDIETSIDVEKIKKYETEQIDYIYNKKSEDFKCDLDLLKSVVNEITNTDNVAEQLNFLINHEDEVKRIIEKKQKTLKFSKKYLDTYRDGRMYFKDEIIIDDTGTKSKIYNGYKSMEYFYNLNSQNENSKDSNTILP